MSTPWHHQPERRHHHPAAKRGHEHIVQPNSSAQVVAIKDCARAPLTSLSLFSAGAALAGSAFFESDGFEAGAGSGFASTGGVNCLQLRCTHLIFCLCQLPLAFRPSFSWRRARPVRKTENVSEFSNGCFIACHCDKGDV